MAYLPLPKTPIEVKSLTVAKVKQEYNKLAEVYTKILDGDIVHCPKCNEFVPRKNYYTDKRYALGVFPECKACILEEVEQRYKKTDKPNETKQSVQKMLQKMDLPYLDSLYESQRASVLNETNEKNKQSPFLAYLVPIKSLPQYSSLTWADSEFALDDMNNPDYLNTETNETVIAGRQRFGDYSPQDLMFLENEYQDWVTRYVCESKAQEILFKRICFKQLEINKAQKSGRDTKELDKTLQELMSSVNVKPSQQSSNTLTESMTFGQLIEKWEQEQPIPEPEEQFKDVDNIGLYIDVFFKGHLSKMMGLKNAFSRIYDTYIKKYTVSKPEYDEDLDSETLMDKIFGNIIEKDEH